MRRVLLIFGVLIVVGVGACGGGDGNSRIAGTVEVEPSHSASAPSAPSARVSEGTPGQPLTSGDSRVTLYAWEQPANLPQAPSGISGPQPGAGAEFAAADVEECASDQARQQITANPFTYKVVGPDNVHHSADPGYRMPPFNGATLYAGDCVRGWVTFQVPVGQRPAYLQWEGFSGGGPPLRWRSERI
jgi:hypothetical protein